MSLDDGGDGSCKITFNNPTKWARTFESNFGKLKVNPYSHRYAGKVKDGDKAWTELTGCPHATESKKTYWKCAGGKHGTFTAPGCYTQTVTLQYYYPVYELQPVYVLEAVPAYSYIYGW